MEGGGGWGEEGAHGHGEGWVVGDAGWWVGGAGWVGVAGAPGLCPCRGDCGPEGGAGHCGEADRGGHGDQGGQGDHGVQGVCRVETGTRDPDHVPGGGGCGAGPGGGDPETSGPCCWTSWVQCRSGLCNVTSVPILSILYPHIPVFAVGPKPGPASRSTPTLRKRLLFQIKDTIADLCSLSVLLSLSMRPGAALLARTPITILKYFR